MSKYGERFDKALTKTLKINRGLRIAMIVVFSFLLQFTAGYGIVPLIPLGLDGGPGVIVLMVALVFTHHCHLRHLFTIHPDSDKEVGS